MVETVGIVLESLERLDAIDGWLETKTRNPVHLFVGERPRVSLIATYNVLGGAKLWDEPRPVGSGTSLRFQFQEPKEAVLFKLTWG